MSADYVILVNSTDSFEDSWYPFFKLLAKFWPHCQQNIILNAETKDFSYPGLDITCTKVSAQDPDRKLPWGESLIQCLDRIDTEILLYLQEDYFLNAPVDVAQINEFVNLIAKENVSHVSLVDFSSGGPWRPTKNPLLWEVDQKAAYRLSLQAGLWRKDRLRFYLRKHESPWHFELWGSKRAHRIKDTFLCVNREIFNEKNRRIISYVPTGIVKGKWNREAVYSLFLENGIQVDFSNRGFCDPSEKPRRKSSLVSRAISRLRSAI